jgi:hypothetical protein
MGTKQRCAKTQRQTEGEIRLALARRAGVHFRTTRHPQTDEGKDRQYCSRAHRYRPEELHEKLLYVHHRSMMLILGSAKVTIRLRPRNEGASEDILLINQQLGGKLIASRIGRILDPAPTGRISGDRGV